MSTPAAPTDVDPLPSVESGACAVPDCPVTDAAVLASGLCPDHRPTYPGLAVLAAVEA